jgi:hypothetical protein
MCDHETLTKRGGPGPYSAVEPYKKKGVVIFTDVSGQSIDPIFKGQAVQGYLTLEFETDILSQNVNKKLPFYAV